MSTYKINRPVWRRFRPKFLKFAAAFVRAGGHAVITEARGRADFLLPVDASGRITELAQWSLLSVDRRRYRRVKAGVAKGLATAKVSVMYAGAVLDWCDRDSIHAGPTRAIELDCLDCGACCHDANVVLEPEDLSRFRTSRTLDLAGKNYVRRTKDGKVTLRFAPSGACQHLKRDNRCRVYALRPNSCRAFVVGSEACLAAREDTLAIRDGDVAP